MGKIPKNALVQLFFVDNKREFGLIWSANFVQLGNHTGTPNPTLDKFNGTTITNYGSPGAAVGAPIGSYTNGSANHGSCNPHSNPIVPDSFIFCGIPSEKERKIKVHPNAPVLNYNSVGFTENGYKRFAASDPVIAPKIMVTHWDVCHNTKSMFDTLIKRGISMGFGVDRDGLIVQMANAGQARFGALGFSEGTVQCEVNNPVEDKPHVLDYNRRCFNGDENGGRRRIPNNFKFPNGATLGYEYIFDFTDPQYFSIGALWEAVGHAYNIPLVIPDDSWIDYRPGDVTDGRVHAFRGATTPEQAKRDIKNHYSGIVFHHNIDWANRGGRVQSGKIDIILLDRKRILSHALQCRADRNAGKF
jgi:hypothetical protein